MAKRIERDGKFYRIRRGKEVEIPEQWVGKTVHPQELRSRNSKRTRQQRDAEAPTRVVDDDFTGAIGFCDCENCAR